MQSEASIPPVKPALGPHTWEEFVALPDDDRRELIDGELLEADVPTELHEYVVGTIFFHLTAWVRARRAGIVFPSGYKVRIDQRRGVMPDVQFYRHGSAAQRESQGVLSGAPDLAVEVISPSSLRYDQISKLNYYASIGTPEYWIVNPEARSLVRHLLRDGHFLIEEALEGDVTFRPSTFEGLSFDLGELWTLPTA
jgi:Uma2 family endonuclease